MTGADTVGVMDGVGDAVKVADQDADTVAVCEGESPSARERVTVAVAVSDGVAVDDDVGVGDGEQRSSIYWLSSWVRSAVASVTLSALNTLSVWLIARVLQVLAIPAAVHDAGAVQHVGDWGFLFTKEILYSCWPFAEPDL